VLDAAKALVRWPAAAELVLDMQAPTLGSTGVGIVRYADDAGAVAAMRGCLRDAIEAAGGKAAEGSQDRCAARPLASAAAGEAAPHIPDICHSTILHWAAEPSPEEQEQAAAAFVRVAAAWEPGGVGEAAAAHGSARGGVRRPSLYARVGDLVGSC